MNVDVPEVLLTADVSSPARAAAAADTATRAEPATLRAQLHHITLVCTTVRLYVHVCRQVARRFRILFTRFLRDCCESNDMT